jgi:hypothetical protein
MKMPGTKFHQITAKDVVEVFTLEKEDDYHSTRKNDIDKLNDRVESLEHLLGAVLNHLGPKFMLDTYIAKKGNNFHYDEYADGFAEDACLVRFVAEKVE